MTLIGELLARASSAAEPAVEAMSAEPERRNSLALLEPADCTHSTLTESPSAVSISFWSRITRLSGL